MNSPPFLVCDGILILLKLFSAAGCACREPFPFHCLSGSLWYIPFLWLPLLPTFSIYQKFPALNILFQNFLQQPQIFGCILNSFCKVKNNKNWGFHWNYLYITLGKHHFCSILFAHSEERLVFMNSELLFCLYQLETWQERASPQRGALRRLWQGTMSKATEGEARGDWAPWY